MAAAIKSVTATAALDEEAVWRLLQGRRFHKLLDPNPKSVADVTSTWTIPSAGKDELIFHDDGTYVFNGEVCFMGGHQLTRAGRGGWTLQQATVAEGEWIALRLAQLAKKEKRPQGCRPEDYVGRSLWQVVIAGPGLAQEGEAMEMDDVNECGVFTEFADDNSDGAGDDDDSDDAPSLAAVVGAGGGSDDQLQQHRKRIKTMTWWVDDVLTWTAERWLSPEEARQRDHRLRNPQYKGLGRGFLNSGKKKKDSSSGGGGSGGGGGGGDRRQPDSSAWEGIDDPAPTVPKSGLAAAAAASDLQFSTFEVGADAESAAGAGGGAATGVRRRRGPKCDKALPPLVPKRADIETAADRPPRPPHTYCGQRIEDLALLCLSVGFFLFVVWYIQ